jgi:hypothetical protein
MVGLRVTDQGLMARVSQAQAPDLLANITAVSRTCSAAAVIKGDVDACA